MYPVERMCVLLKVSRSGLYDYCLRKESNRFRFDKVVLGEIRQIHAAYGSPRITSALHDKGYQVSKVKVAKLMKKNQISSITKKRYKVTTD